MRRSWLDILAVPAWIIGLLLVLAVTVAPVIGALGSLGTGWRALEAQGAALPYWSWGSVPARLAITLAWVGSIIVGACVVGIPAGVALGRLSGARASVLRALCVSVLCLPPYLLYWTWGLPVGGSTGLVQWVSASPWRAQALQVWQLWWGLVWWTWPFVALSVSAATARMDHRIIEAMRVDGASCGRIFFNTVKHVRSSIALGAGLAMLFTLTSFAAFDLASTSLPIADTFDSILRRIRFEVGPGAALAAATPLLAVHAVVALVVLGMLGRADWRTVRRPDSGTGARETMTLAGALFVSLAAPVAILIWRLGSVEPLMTLGSLEGQAIVQSSIWAIIAGAIVGALTALFALAFLDDRKWIGRIAGSAGALLVLMAVLPATTRGSLIVQAWSALDWTSKRWFGAAPGQLIRFGSPDGWSATLPIPVLIGYVATFGFGAVFVARWVAVSEAGMQRNLRVLDGATRPGGILRSTGWAITSASVATGLFTLVLALGEVSTTMIVLPPGAKSVTQRLLNKMHYAYEDSAVATCLVMMGVLIPLAIVASYVLSGGAGQRRRRRLGAGSVAPILLLALLLVVPACGQPSEPTSEAPVAHRISLIREIGSVGRGPGQFVYPRAVDFDPINRFLYAIDRSGRIQRFDPDGTLNLTIALPAFAHGYPTGVTVQPGTGHVYVADTHEHRVLILDSNGRVIDSFGSQGTAPGQFVYPTDIEFGPEGQVYVSEYGGKDRIQVFDQDHNFEFEFGERGHGDGQFNRPQSIRYNPQRNELIIVDACNHRIVFTDLKGGWIDTIGSPGDGPGELNYPYGLVLLPDDSMIISEFGGGRLSHLARDGTPLGTFGQTGGAPGQFVNAWGLCADGNTLYVADGGNHRVSMLKYRP